MPVLVLPWTFVNGTVADADQVDDDFAAVAAVVNALDNANIGPGGFFASQIIPTNLAQATFGGAVGYTFRPQVTSQVPLSVRGANGQTADVFDITDYTNTIQLFVDSNYALHVINALYNSNLQMGANSQITFNPTPANATNIISHSGGITDIATGCHWDGTQYVADATITAILRFDGGTNPPIACYVNTGLTVGLGFVPILAWECDQLGDIQMGNSSAVRFGSSASAVFGISGNTYVASGAHWNYGTAQWIADTATASILVVNDSGTSPGMTLFFNAGLTIGSAFSPTAVLTLVGGTGVLAVAGAVTANGVFPGSSGLNSPNSCGLWSGTGVPAAGVGSNGDYYFRKDGGLASHIYFKVSGTWTALTSSTL